MNVESWLLGLNVVTIVAMIGLILYIISLERIRRRQSEQWENDIYDLYDKLQKKLDQTSVQLLNKLNEDLARLDENTQKRHNYLKKSFNDIADRLDLVEQMEKRVKDLYYQLERSTTKLDELAALLPKTLEPPSTLEADTKSPIPVMDEEVMKVLHYYRQGMKVEEIAQLTGRAIPEIQLTIHIFAEHV